MISLTLFRVNTFPSIFNQRIKINLKLTKHYSVKGRGCFKPIPWFKKGHPTKQNIPSLFGKNTKHKLPNLQFLQSY
jgi:hypothetical protein